MSNWPPHLTVATIVERDGRFLMVEEHQLGRLVLNQPAGHLEPGETLLAAAVRETREETGWEVSLDAITGIYHYTVPEAGITYHRITFAAAPVAHVTSRLDPDINAALWLSLDEIRARQADHRSPTVMRCLQDHADGHRYPLALLQHLD